MTAIPKPPALGLLLTELPRAASEGLRVASNLGRLVKESPKGDGHPVLVLPGYAAADGSTGILRLFLRQIGYRPFALSLGRNVEGLSDRIRSVDDATRFREKMVRRVVARLRAIHRETGERVSLVGWSMGGLYALDASRVAPGITRRVITLGSPFGDPRGSSMFTVMRRLNRSKVPLGQQDFDGWTRKAGEPAVPTQVIFSAKDGFVSEEIARLPDSPHTEHLRVDSSHIGLAINPSVLREIALTLAKRVTA